MPRDSVTPFLDIFLDARDAFYSWFNRLSSTPRDRYIPVWNQCNAPLNTVLINQKQFEVFKHKKNLSRQTD